MYKTTAKIDGMMCSMCEAHIQEAIRKEIPVKKVTASHTKGEAVILSAQEIDAAQLHAAIDPTGYTLGELRSEPYEKKGSTLFEKR